MRILRLIIICLLATGMFAPRALSDVSAEERKKAFDWFDSLGYPDIAKLPLVKVYVGYWSDIDGPKRTPAYEYGFLTQRDGKRFSVCLLTLNTENLTISPRTKETDLFPHEPIYFEAADLQDYAHLLIKQIAEGKQPLFTQKAGLSITLLVLARACEGHGFTELAAQLFHLAVEDMPIRKEGDPQWSFLERIGNEISRGVIWQLTLDFENPKITRSTLLRQYNAFLPHFPSSEYRALALDTDTELKRMVSEDREFAVRPAALPGKVSQKSRIADLIFALRDQNGRQLGQPGCCDVFLDPRGEKSPASQLVKIGFPAVPALLEALTDSRLTRSVEFGRSFFFSHRVLRIGDVANVVLQRIAKRSFESSPELKWSPLWNERAASIQIGARKWWTEVQAKGEAEVLTEEVQRGDNSSVEQAQYLIEQHPDAAVPALAQGLKNAATDYIRQGLTRVAGDLPIAAVLPVLKTQLREGKDLGTRVEAAYALYARGDAAAVKCMIQEWRKRPPMGSGGEAILSFLVDCLPLEAIEAIGEGLQDRDVDTRFAVVRAVRHISTDYSEVGAKSSSLRKAPRALRQARAERVERLLVGLLRDVSLPEGEALINSGGDSIRNPRLCDLANRVLAELWPQNYRYHNSRSRFERDYECIEMANRWRAAHDLAPLPLSSLPHNRPAAPSHVQPLLRQFARTHSVRERHLVENRIVTLGLPALSAVHKAGRRDAQRSVAGQWLALEKRLSTIVRGARIERNGLQPNASLVRKMAAIEGRPLTFIACNELVESAIHTMRGDAAGIRFSARREKDGAGFTVLLTMLPFHAEPFRSQNITGYADVLVGFESVTGSTETNFSDDRSRRGRWKEVRVGLQKALNSDSYQSVTIQIQHGF